MKLDLSSYTINDYQDIELINQYAKELNVRTSSVPMISFSDWLQQKNIDQSLLPSPNDYGLCLFGSRCTTRRTIGLQKAATKRITYEAKLKQEYLDTIEMVNVSRQLDLSNESDLAHVKMRLRSAIRRAQSQTNKTSKQSAPAATQLALTL